MTRRERLERKLEQRREWKEKREEKADSCFKVGEPYRGDIAFNTQPGHIPERARVIAAEERGVEHLNMAKHHGEQADGIENQLERSIFSDDLDAIGQLEARISSREAEAERMVAANKAWRKSGAEGLIALGWSKTEADLAAHRIETAYSWEKQPFPKWELSNLRANIRRDKQRIEEIRARQSHEAEVEKAGGILLEDSPEWNGYCRVTFSEKPAREILDALRSAGFRWQGGTWGGRRDLLPVVVEALILKEE